MNEEYENVDDEDNLLEEEDSRNSEFKKKNIYLHTLHIDLYLDKLTLRLLTLQSYSVDGFLGVSSSSLQPRFFVTVWHRDHSYPSIQLLWTIRESVRAAVRYISIRQPSIRFGLSSTDLLQCPREEVHDLQETVAGNILKKKLIEISLFFY